MGQWTFRAAGWNGNQSYDAYTGTLSVTDTAGTVSLRVQSLFLIAALL